MGNLEYDCTTKEIAEYADVSSGVAKQDILRLVDCGVVAETRKIGGVQLYMLNNTSPVTEALIDLDRILSKPEPGDFETRAIPEEPEKYHESEEVWDS